MKAPDYLKDMLVRAKLQFEGFDNAMQPQKPYRETVRPVFALCHALETVSVFGIVAIPTQLVLIPFIFCRSLIYYWIIIIFCRIIIICHWIIIIYYRIIITILYSIIIIIHGLILILIVLHYAQREHI